MDFLPDSHTINHWLLLYGGVVLFLLLALGIIALPVPDETLMVFAGVLMSKGKLKIVTTLLAAYGGSMCGITVSYLIGRTAGNFFIHRYGAFIGLTEDKIENVHKWFKKYGKWTLMIGYFIPGVRHFTGIIAGMSSLEYKHFALFAYTGAFIWASFFMGMGYFFGGYWFVFFENLESNIEIISIVLILIIFAYSIFKLWTSK